MQNRLFDLQFRLEQLDKGGDPLARIDETVVWEPFRPNLATIRDKERKSPAGRKAFDAVMMFKALVLQSLYNLGDDALEFQVRDRLCFMRFLRLTLGDTTPDAKTFWAFRGQLPGAAGGNAPPPTRGRGLKRLRSRGILYPTVRWR